MRRLARLLVAVVVVLVLAVVALFVAVLVLAKAYRIPSSSMEPTLHCARPGAGCTASTSDRVLVLRFVGPVEPGRGDLVAFETPPAAAARCGAGGVYLHRIVGLPRERVAFEDGRVVVNGRPLAEPYARGTTEPFRRTRAAVPAGHYLVLGDNRTMSCDSRVWGTVPRDNLIGQVVAVYWPPDRISIR